MPIPLGILAAAGFRPSAAGAFDLLESTVLTSAQASVEFTNLTTKYSAQYEHLQIRWTGRTERNNSGVDGLNVRVNNNTGSNYSMHSIIGLGSSVSSGGASSSTFAEVSWIATNTAPSSVFSGGVIDLLDPFSTTKNKTFRALDGTTSIPNIRLSSAAFYSTNSVTSLLLFPAFGPNFVTGSRFSLYGIRGS
jgi:hypothetical protein